MKEFYNDLIQKRPDYRSMIDFCCDSLVLNNTIISELSAHDFYFDIYCGADYDENDDYYYDVYQTFIISESDAERLSRYTNEIVYYNEQLDLYLLGVTHFGTPWNGVPANWKTPEEMDA